MMTDTKKLRALPLNSSAGWPNGWEMEVTGSGLGYKNWLVTSHSVAPANKADNFIINANNRTYVIHHHPFIRAKKIHADELGVPIGSSIAGVRWVSDWLNYRPAKIEDVLDNPKGEK